MKVRGESSYTMARGGHVTVLVKLPVTDGQAQLLKQVGLKTAVDVAEAAVEFDPMSNLDDVKRVITSQLDRVARAKGGAKPKAVQNGTNFILEAITESPIDRMCEHFSDEDNRESYVVDRRRATVTASTLQSLMDLLKISGFRGTDKELEEKAIEQLELITTTADPEEVLEELDSDNENIFDDGGEEEEDDLE